MKAFKEGAFPDEFVRQAHSGGEEVAAQYAYVLDRFRRYTLLLLGNGPGVLMRGILWTWRSCLQARRRALPGRGAEDLRAARCGRGPDAPPRDVGALLVVMSDHGFTSWRRPSTQHVVEAEVPRPAHR